MADYSTQIAAIEEAIAAGAKRVTFMSGGTRREVEYHSLSDMLNALDRLKMAQSRAPAVTFGAFRMGR